jgi:hypothetical protein
MRNFPKVALALFVSVTAAPVLAQQGNAQYWSTGPIRYAPCWKQPYYGYPYPCGKTSLCAPEDSTAEHAPMAPATPQGQANVPYPGPAAPPGFGWGGGYLGPFPYGYR